MKQFYYTLMFIALIISFLFLIIGLKFAESAPQEASDAGFACAFGIICRILQAEAHKSE